MFYVVIVVIVLLLIFLPQMWVQSAIRRHSKPRSDFPGTGGELARHLLDEAGLQSVGVEITETGDHYDPGNKVIGLLAANYNGKSVSAVAIAAHEFGHALQDAQGYGPLRLRTRMAGPVRTLERFGGIVLMAIPVVAALTRSPSVVAMEIGAGLLIMSSGIAFHLITLPVEFDASFNRALPILKAGKYLDNNDLPAAEQVLKAAAFTYVSAALTSLLNISRWLRLIR